MLAALITSGVICSSQNNEMKKNCANRRHCRWRFDTLRSSSSSCSTDSTASGGVDSLLSSSTTVKQQQQQKTTRRAAIWPSTCSHRSVCRRASSSSSACARVAHKCVRWGGKEEWARVRRVHRVGQLSSWSRKGKDTCRGSVRCRRVAVAERAVWSWACGARWSGARRTRRTWSRQTCPGRPRAAARRRVSGTWRWACGSRRTCRPERAPGRAGASLRRRRAAWSWARHRWPWSWHSVVARTLCGRRCVVRRRWNCGETIDPPDIDELNSAQRGSCAGMSSMSFSLSSTHNHIKQPLTCQSALATSDKQHNGITFVEIDLIAKKTKPYYEWFQMRSV